MINSDSSIDSLIKSLRQGDLNLRCKAASQAGKERVRAAVPALVELLYTTGPGSKRLITTCARALGEIGDLRAMQHLGEAGYAHRYSGGLPGFTTYGSDGRVVPVDSDDALMDEAIHEAEHKLWQHPGASEYLAQLGRIKMYTFEDFLRTNNIYIDSDIQRQRHYPFTMQCAKRFFDNFLRQRFAFEGEIKSILIGRGKEALPRASFADGKLYPQTLDQLAELSESAWHSVGDIHFEFGGNATTPYIVVNPEPKWPRPSIVRRYVLDGKTGIRFEEA